MSLLFIFRLPDFYILIPERMRETHEHGRAVDFLQGCNSYSNRLKQLEYFSVSDPDPHKDMPPGSGSRRLKKLENIQVH